MCRLALAFAGRLRDKNPFRTAGLITFPPPAVFKLLNDTGTYQEDRKLFCTCLVYCAFCFSLAFSLITFANSLEPDQARRSVGSGLGPNCLTL